VQKEHKGRKTPLPPQLWRAGDAMTYNLLVYASQLVWVLAVLTTKLLLGGIEALVKVVFTLSGVLLLVGIGVGVHIGCIRVQETEIGMKV
jgi:hypothetical protein